MNTFAIDFETYYDRDYSLKKMDAYSYVHHPKFDCYLMSVYGVIPSSVAAGGDRGSSIGNHQPRQSRAGLRECRATKWQSEIGNVFQWVGRPKEFNQWHLFENAILVAHNAAFDSLVFRRLQENGVIPEWVGRAVPSEPKSPPVEGCPKGGVGSQQSNTPIFQSFRDLCWRCTASMAVYLQAPRSLKGACKQLLNIDVDKTQRSKASGQSGADLFGNEAMFTYALEDARLCFLLWEKFNHLWPDDEQELATLTFEWAQQGIAVDLQTLEQSIKTLETQRFNAVQNLPWVDDPDSDTPLSHSKLAVTCREAGIPCPVSLAMDDPDCEAWEEKFGPEYPWVDSMRTFRRTNMLLSRFYTVRNRSIPNVDAMSSSRSSVLCPPSSDRCNPAFGRFPYALKYFGAVPGRWSGDAGFNVQNMPRGELFGVNLRKCFQPSDGNVFIIADLCQIEPRILAWLIEDEAFLSLVRSGVDIYEAHARSTMGYSDPSPLKEVDPDKRALAKARVLGLGYGCGPQKFVTVAKNLGGIDISLADAKKTVADFRSKNPRISRLWNQLDRDFKRSAGGDYSIKLPSGRVLRYFNVVKTPRGYYAAATERGGKLRSLYGCLLTENLVQATARDLFAHHLLEIHRYLNPNSPPLEGCRDGGVGSQASTFDILCSTFCGSGLLGRVVFHVHDEVIVEVPASCADEAREQIQAIMSTAPDWLSGCPVAAESKILTRYTK